MLSATIEVGPNAVALGLAILAFLNTVFLAWKSSKQAKELKPNGGSSLRDAVDRIEQHTAATSAAVAPTAASTPVGGQVAAFPPPPPPAA